MSKQTDIEVGLRKIKLSEISYDGKTKHPHFLSPIDTKNILSYLSENGVVIKAPMREITADQLVQGTYKDEFTTVQPLIERRKDEVDTYVP